MKTTSWVLSLVLLIVSTVLLVASWTNSELNSSRLVHEGVTGLALSALCSKASRRDS